MVKVSISAKEKVSELMSEGGFDPNKDFVRVGVKSGGCSGLSYDLKFDKEKDSEDKLFEDNMVRILVDKKSHLYIKNTEIDWSYGLMDRGLVFNNPSAKGSCGCKTSFMFEHPEQEEDFKPSWM